MRVSELSKRMGAAAAAGAIAMGGMLLSASAAQAQEQPAPPPPAPEGAPPAPPEGAPPAPPEGAPPAPPEAPEGAPPAPQQPAPPPPAPEVDLDLPDVVATVNGNEIAGDELEQLVQQVQQMAQQDPRMQQMGMPTGEEILDEVVNQKILHVIAEERGHTVSSAEVDETIDEIKQSIPDPDMFDMLLEQQGLTEASLRDQIEQDMVTGRLIEELADDIEVTEEEKDDQYDQLQVQIGAEEMPGRDEVDADLDEMIRGQKQQEQLRGLIEEARADMDIEILVDPADLELEAPEPPPMPDFDQAPAPAPQAPDAPAPPPAPEAPAQPEGF